MILKKIKPLLYRNYINAQGWRTNRKILVIESDDWGSIRMPGKNTYTRLRKSPLGKSLNLFDSLDCLERRADFQNLLELTESFRDFKHNPLIITMNTVMQNPNFEKIKDSGFNEFHGTPFFQSYNDYYGEELRDLWKKGMADKLIKPQFHAREHLNEYLWLKDLRNGYKDVKLGFDHGFFGTRTLTSSKLRNHYLSTYFSETPEEYQSVEFNTINGLRMFKEVFGFFSKSFIASNYTWPSEIEDVLHKNKIKFIQSQFGNNITNFNKGTRTTRRHYTGERNLNKQVYTVRNVVFEPSMNPNRDWINSAMEEVDNAFFWKKPAIISMHRVNFASDMNVRNRDESLASLKGLIRCLLKKYPKIEFLDSEELGQLILK